MKISDKSVVPVNVHEWQKPDWLYGLRPQGSCPLLYHDEGSPQVQLLYLPNLMVTQASFLGRLGDLLRSVPCSSDAILRRLKSEMATWFSVFTLHPSLDNPSPSTFLLCDATTPCHWQTRRSHGGSIHPSAPSRVACRVAATSYYILQICLT